MDLDWKDQLLFSKERASMLLKEGLLSDVSFSLTEELTDECQIFRAHKIFLASHSSVFSAMFFGPLAENTDHPIPIEDIKPKTFEMFLNCIYADTVELKSWKDAGDLFYVAKKYMLNGLAKYCLNFIEKQISPLNVLHIYKFAEFYEEKKLLELALQIIRNNTLSVLKSSHFYEMDIKYMMTILDQDKLQANEMDLFQALNDTRKRLIGKPEMSSLFEFQLAAKKINYLLMTVEQFSKGPANSFLLAPDDSSSIIDCLIDPTKIEILYPKDFVRNIRTLKVLPRVFFEISVNESTIGHIIIELRSDVVPNVTKIFQSLCTGEKPYGFKGSFITEIKKMTHVTLGAPINRQSGKPVALNPIAFEGYELPFARPGILAMRHNTETSTRGRFFITCCEIEKWNKKCTVLGEVIEGMRVVNTLRTYGNELGKTFKKIRIENCGRLQC